MSDICKRAEEGRLSACSNLQDAVGGVRVIIQRVEHQEAAVLRAGKHQRRGVVMNFCPFCGERIFTNDATSSPPAS